MAAWTDTKDAILKVLIEGFQQAGFGIQPLGTQPADPRHPTLNFYRAFGQQLFDRPLLTVARQSSTVSAKWLGNLGLFRTPSANEALTIPIHEVHRIRVEATQDTGGIETVDWILEVAATSLVAAYPALMLPVEEGGYGLYLPGWRYASDTATPFSQELAGKIVYSNEILFDSERFLSGTSPTSPTLISGVGVTPNP